MPTPEELTEAAPLRDAIAARLAAATHDGRHLDAAHAVALANQLLSIGFLESVWSGTRSEPEKFHSVRIGVSEEIGRDHPAWQYTAMGREERMRDEPAYDDEEED